MNVFEFRNRVIAEYENFSRSFSKFLSTDIKAFVDNIYEGQHFCPSPLIQLNPSFVPGRTIEKMVAEGILDPECSKIFRIGKDNENLGYTLPLHKHQDEAIQVARRGESYVLTTGTGSGKSLSYFIPIVDAIIKEKKAGSKGNKIRAIIVYPMNALCNSQLEELEKFLCRGYGKNGEPVTFGRYTGQEKEEERHAMAQNPPDIILTNFMMLELLMTRQSELDKAIVRAADGLRFLVLDELHTYRGRQGADVAILVRRVRQAFNTNLLCVGTSATMLSEGDPADRKVKVAEVAGRLFGANVKSENVITETLQRVTPDNIKVDDVSLKAAIQSGVPEKTIYDVLRQHIFAAWIELNLGLAEEDGKWVRARPITINSAAQILSERTKIDIEICRDYLTRFLLLAYNTKDTNDKSLFAFRLHQFVSGAGDLFTTLEPEGIRHITVDGQQFKPGDRTKRLFNAVFCRECGQEYYPVWGALEGHSIQSIEPRSIDEKTHDEDDIRYGFFMPDTTGKWNDADIENNYPEDWIEYVRELPRLKSSFKSHQPKFLKVNTMGEAADDGLRGWYFPGNFRFCLNPECKVVYDGSIRSDIAKLSSLGTEGRSSATTILTISSLRYLLNEANDLSARAKKLLGFTDNRQDASLQAGHFNDFVQILLMRGALLAAVKSAKDGFLTDDILTQAVFSRLNLDKSDFMANPEAPPFIQMRVEQTLRDLLGYRLYYDLRRGWRIMNPNLEQLGLLKIDYLYLDELCAQDSYWKSTHPLLANALPDKRKEVAAELLDMLRRSLCIKTTYLDRYKQEQMKNASFTDLKEPWGLSEEDKFFEGCYMLCESRPANVTDYRAVYLSSRSKFGKFLRKTSTWGGPHNPHYPEKFKQDDFDQLMSGLLTVLNGIVEPLEVDKKKAYVLNAAALKWTTAENDSADKAKKNENRFFIELYLNVANMLQDKNRLLHQLEAREHTAQVDPEEREKREDSFRIAKLPVMFCSPTMELGVDIAELNTVYMRNVPPTPAHYAQRSGRAGRSGQPAFVITYCAAKSPHDQYFFSSPIRMVSGSVTPPTLDLANEDLVKSHLHAVWLSETGQKLESSVNGILSLEQNNLPILTSLFSTMDTPAVRARASARAITILSMLNDELTHELAPWYKGDWLERVIKGAFRSFDQALDRWRTLYQATVRQLNASHIIQMNAAATEKERKEAKLRYNEARIQQELLLKSNSKMTSDFYTYRYLASQGFLPGYNFPRLPLLAFIPARREKIGRDAFLSRSRFLALSEFGPLSLIYHEGSQYRVRKVIISLRDEEGTGNSGLPVRAARICPECGYGHFGSQMDDERCNSCNAPMDGGMYLHNLYRVENVSTRRAMRITSDEEERIRQGYETQTTIQYAQENSTLQVTKTVFSEGGKDILRLHYGPAATVWRINLGWRRRKNKSIYGFNINPSTGAWSKDIQAPEDVNDDATVDANTEAVQRIIPFVEDRRNVLIVYTVDKMDNVALTTLQYVLKRGIEGTFQLEESELMAEPLPSRDVRNAILFYESAEGGAGVLTRLANDLTALRRIIVKGLEMCHYTSRTGHWQPDELDNLHSDCEAGCYKCLLSYYNQPEHSNIDRRNADVLELLCRLTRAEGRKGTEGRSAETHYDDLVRLSGSSLEKAWLRFIYEHGYNLPDRAQVLLEQFNTRPDFAYSRSQAVIYIDGPHHDQDSQKKLDEKITVDLNDAGITVIRFLKEQAIWPSVIAKYPDIFGKGDSA